MIGTGTATADYAAKNDAADDADLLLKHFAAAFQNMQYMVQREQAKISGLAMRRFLTIGASEHGRKLFSKKREAAVEDALEELADCLVYLAYAVYLEGKRK